MRLVAALCVVVASLVASLLTSLAARPAIADEFYHEHLRIAMPAAGPNGLEALLIRPARPQRYPLALISHGASGDALERPEMTPFGFYRQAIEFARHGFAALVVMRRGYGGSGGSFAEGHSCCEARTFLGSAKESADDLRAAIMAMKSRNDVTTQGMIAVGVSGGGLASIALTLDPPPGLAAVISFAGGLARAQQQVNDARAAGDEAGLVDAYKTLGEGSRIPMLWIYAANDSYFRPEFAHRLLAAFTSGGGHATLIDAPAFGSDGHLLFSSGTAMWPTMVDDFLREQKLGARDILPPPAVPALPVPPRLSDKGRASFADYLTAGPHKAFAVAPSGAFGYWSGTRSLEAAKGRAISNCRINAPDCAIYAIDNSLAGAEASNHR
jgi:dienelactone hydrolase